MMNSLIHELEVNPTDISDLLRTEGCCLNIMFRNKQTKNADLLSWPLIPALSQCKLQT